MFGLALLRFVFEVLALCACFFALRAIASLALRARSQRAAGGGFAGAKLRRNYTCASRLFFLGSLCGAKLGFGGKPLL